MPSAARGTRPSWVFEPERFSPLAKFVESEYFSIVTNHLGTLTALFDHAGNVEWSAGTSIFGGLSSLRGPRQTCPFRWPGQYEDCETDHVRCLA